MITLLEHSASAEKLISIIDTDGVSITTRYINSKCGPQFITVLMMSCIPPCMYVVTCYYGNDS